MKVFDAASLTKLLRRNKYVLLTLCLGLVLLLLPRGEQTQTAAEPQGYAVRGGEGNPMAASGIPMDTECCRIAALLSSMRGVGEAQVLLSDSGAVVVCAGADDPAVRLDVTHAVSAYTGLGSNKITVMKMK